MPEAVGTDPLRISRQRGRSGPFSLLSGCGAIGAATLTAAGALRRFRNSDAPEHDEAGEGRED
ncbi:hypothetical protein [Streptomyces sp. NPDC053427]|uniref:hypothetical protein n=1 Tax=Streptomyces sp. NPDC053427 TaxID=3365701 RepID=UPI0037CFC910